MCEKCEKQMLELDEQATKLAEMLAKHLTDAEAGNEAVFLAATKLMMASVLAMKMPPQVFLPMMCEFYSNATGFEVVPLQVAEPASNTESDPKSKPN